MSGYNHIAERGALAALVRWPFTLILTLTHSHTHTLTHSHTHTLTHTHTHTLTHSHTHTLTHSHTHTLTPGPPLTWYSDHIASSVEESLGCGPFGPQPIMSISQVPPTHLSSPASMSRPLNCQLPPFSSLAVSVQRTQPGFPPSPRSSSWHIVRPAPDIPHGHRPPVVLSASRGSLADSDPVPRPAIEWRARSRFRARRRCCSRRLETRFGEETAHHQKPGRCTDEGRRRPQGFQARLGEDLVPGRALRAGYVVLAPIRHGGMLRVGAEVAIPQV